MQEVSPSVTKITSEAFERQDETAIYWLGSAGILINSHGTTILLDPDLDQVLVNGRFYNKLNGNKMFQQIPIDVKAIPKVDAILYTHADEDHVGIESYKILSETGTLIHCPQFVKNFLIENGVSAQQIVEHEKLDSFYINEILIEMTLADHPWHRSKPNLYDYYYTVDDCTGYKISTRDGVIWNPGDSILLAEHLNESPVDLLFIDFSNDPFHFGIDGARKLANQQKSAQLIPIHWGTYESEKPCFNADPYAQQQFIEDNERLQVIAIGEKYVLEKRSIKGGD